MPWFKCFIAGENLPGRLIGKRKPVGFYTTRFVQAPSPETVESLALDGLRKEKKLRLPAGVNRPKESMIYFEEIVKVDASEVKNPPPGIVWYEMET